MSHEQCNPWPRVDGKGSRPPRGLCPQTPRIYRFMATGIPLPSLSPPCRRPERDKSQGVWGTGPPAMSWERATHGTHQGSRRALSRDCPKGVTSSERSLGRGVGPMGPMGPPRRLRPMGPMGPIVAGAGVPEGASRPHLLHPVARDSRAIRPSGAPPDRVRRCDLDTSVAQTFFGESLRIALQPLRTRSSPGAGS